MPTQNFWSWSDSSTDFLVNTRDQYAFKMNHFVGTLFTFERQRILFQQDGGPWLWKVEYEAIYLKRFQRKRYNRILVFRNLLASLVSIFDRTFFSSKGLPKTKVYLQGPFTNVDYIERIFTEIVGRTTPALVGVHWGNFVREC